ncbi:hypothetical protein C6P40_005508 [Pichia californica]|uniref:Ubiquitin-like domain-containing protein n=1 Tax=Pichia californica TaxID=460514 RepID=A0A9P7BGF2_9ASCO|nr:hypothetical protein C6P42_004573 [[Candida] californica]KAG0689135.1 hypothetical protein C6P40_005508 [[Candida] californica]
MTTEVEFANKFVQLLEVTTPSADSQQAFADSFNLNSITKLPPNFTFPPLAHPYGTINQSQTITSGSDESEKSAILEEESLRAIEITFKSLKQPKFNLQLVLDVKSSSNVYTIKTALSHLLKNSSETLILVQPSDIKLMIRTKTLQDSENVFQILENTGSPDKLALNVLITQFKPKEVEPEIPVLETSPTITDESWSKISEILLHDLKDQTKVNTIISGFKKSL